MSNQYLKLRRSAVPGKVPDTASLDFGEIALNTHDGLAFMKISSSVGQEVIAIGGGAGDISGSTYYAAIFSGSSAVVTGSIYDSGSFTAIGATTTPHLDAPERLFVDASDTESYNLISGHGSIDNYLQLNIKNFSSAATASSDVVATADNGDETSFFIDMGVNSSGYNVGDGIGSSNDAYLYSTAQDLLIGNASAGKRVIIFNGSGPALDNARIYITPEGTVGINASDTNVSNPEALLVEPLASGSGLPTDFSNLIVGRGTVNESYLQLNMINLGTGSYASTDIVASNDIGTETTNYIDMGINASTHIVDSTFAPGGANDSYLLSTANDLLIGSATSGQVILWTGPDFDDKANAKLILKPNNEHEVTGSLNFEGGASISTSAGNIDVKAGPSGWSQLVSNDTDQSVWVNNDAVYIGTDANTSIKTFIFDKTGSLTIPDGGFVYGTASWALNSLTSSISVNSLTSSLALTASSADDFVVRNSLTASNALITGTITAQTLVVQTVTSSIVYSSGSNDFGSQLTDQQTFTGSVNITGSLTVNGYTAVTSDMTGSMSVATASFAQTASYVVNAISASYAYTASSAISSSFAISASYVPASGVVGLNLSQISTGSVTASVNLGTAAFSVVSSSLALLTSYNNGALNHGTQSLASGKGSHAEGFYVTASGDYSHAEGTGTKAIILGAHAEGSNTIASGFWSHAEGVQTISFGDFSHAEGAQTSASKEYSHAEGQVTVASGLASHAEGSNTTARGVSAHAEGYYTVALGDYSHAQGQYNVSSSVQSSFIIGNGTNDTNRSNLVFAAGSQFQITGSLRVSGSITGSLFGTASWAQNSITASYALNVSGTIANATTASYAYTASSAISSSFAISASYVPASGVVGLNLSQISTGSVTASVNLGTNSFNVVSSSVSLLTSYNNGALNHGNLSTASGIWSHAEGQSTIASGSYSHTEGYYTYATGLNSHAEGEYTEASGFASHAEGGSTIASGNISHAEGAQSEASGLASHAEGLQTEAIGSYSHAEGNSSTSSGSYSHAEGFNTFALGQSAHSEGQYAEALGNYSHAEGYNTFAIGEYSHAEGYFTEARGDYSHAEGRETIASASYQHVQGQYNLTSSIQSAFIVGNGTNASNRSNLIFAAGSTVQITGSLRVSGSITGSLFGTASWARNALTASFLASGATSSLAISASYAFTASSAISASQAQTASYVLNAISSSYAFTASSAVNSTNALTASSADNFVVRNSLTASNALITGTITAQTLVVQTVSSSVVYSSGSNVFGNDLTNTQVFTGSVSVTGSLSVNGSYVVLSNQTGSMSVLSASLAQTASYVLNAVSASYAFTASSAISSSLAQTASFALNVVTASLTGSFVTLDTIQTISGSKTFASFVTASSAIARGTNFTPILSASANNDVLVGLDVSPTFNNGAFTGVINADLRLGTRLLFNATNWTLGDSNYSSISHNAGLKISSLNIGSHISFRGIGFATYMQMFNNTGNFVLQNGGTFTDNGYRLQVSGSGAASGSIYIDGLSTFAGNISGSQPSNNPSSSLILISGSIIPNSGSTTGASAVLMNTVMSASANSQLLVGLDINPSFVTTGFTTIPKIQLKVGNVAVPNNGWTQNYVSSIFEKAPYYMAPRLIMNGSQWNFLDGTGGSGNGQWLLTTNSGGSLFYNSAGGGSHTQFGTSDATVGIALVAANVRQIQINTNGNTLVQTGGTFTDNGYKFQLNGSSSASGSLWVSGSSVMSGSLIVTQGITGSLFGTASWAQNALTASFITPGATSSLAISASYAYTASSAISASQAQTASYVLNAISSSYSFTASSAVNSFTAISSSNAATASSADNFVVRQALTASNALINGTITAQTLVVSTVSSSVVYSSGSNVFGNSLTNTQVFTGSVSVTGSLSVNGSNVVLSNQTGSMSVLSASLAQTASYVLNAVSASYAFTASSAISASQAQTASYVINAISASYAFTASSAISSSVAATASYANSGFDIGIAEFQTTSSITLAGTTIVSSINTGSFTSCFYNYTIASGSNARSGQVMSVWNGANVRYIEVTTMDIGNTATASFAVALSGPTVRLSFTAPGSWTVKNISNLL